MFSWLYQVLLSFVARVLSWFGISFSAKEAKDVSEALQVAQQAAQHAVKEDEPRAPSILSGPQPYSSDSPQEALQ